MTLLKHTGGGSAPNPAPLRANALETFRLLESCPRSVMVMGEDRTIIYTNLRMARLLGVPREMLVGSNLRLYDAVPGQYEKLVDRLGRDGTLPSCVAMMRRVGHPDFVAEMSGEEIQFGGKRAFALWVEDITASRLNEETLNRLFDSAPLPMLLCGAQDGLIRKANRRAFELFIMGRQVGKVRLEDIIGATNYRAFRHRLLGGGFVDDFEVSPYTAYGESFMATLSGQVMQIADERCVLVGITDITDRKQAEQTLRRFFDNAPLAMLQVRARDNVVLRINRRASELLTVSNADNAIARTLGDYVGSTTQTAFLANLHEGGFVDAFEARLATDYGESIWTLLSGQLVEVDGERCVLVGITDITERRLSEEQLRRAESEAVRATEVKSLFLATMSHEIRTPMNGVLGMLDVLATTEMTGEQGEMVGVISNSARTLLTIIDDILDLSKIEAGRLTLERVGLSVHDTVETAVELLSAKARERGVELACCVDPALPERVMGDPTRLRQILLNLLSNGVKFTDAGSVVARAMMALGSDGKARLRFEVQDSGIGISLAVQERLFQPFTQADASTTRHYGGTGLGLSICRRLVGLMGGLIGVNSTEGRGATFWFELPMEADPIPAEPLPITFADLRVLVAEDLLEARHSITNILRSLGADVFEAASAAEAADWLNTHEVDLALVDTDGCFASIDKLLESLPGHCVLRLTNRSDPPSGSIRKPLRRAVLLRGVSLALGRLATEPPHPISHRTSATLRDAPSIDAALAAGRLILVAEDNFTNRLVLGKQLSRLGFAYEMVEDGEAAWLALAEKPYAVLLTDCSMPRLDGYGLTRRIREAESRSGAHLPILALTAHALDSDAERCRAVGMDDHLSKPIALEKLSALLERWLPFPTEGDIAEVPEPPPPVVAPAMAVDLAALADLLGDDDPGELHEVLLSFIECFQELALELRRTVVAGDRDGLRDAAHSAKGASRNCCAPFLAETVAKLEASARDGVDWPVLSALVDRADQLFVAVQAFAAMPPPGA